MVSGFIVGREKISFPCSSFFFILTRPLNANCFGKSEDQNHPLVLLINVFFLWTGCSDDSIELPQSINRIFMRGHVYFPDRTPSPVETLELSVTLSGEGTVNRTYRGYGSCTGGQYTYEIGPDVFLNARFRTQLAPDSNGAVQFYAPVQYFLGDFSQIVRGRLNYCPRDVLSRISQVSVLNVGASLGINEQIARVYCSSYSRSECRITEINNSGWTQSQRSCFDVSYNACYPVVINTRRLTAETSIYASSVMSALRRGDASVQLDVTDAQHGTLRTTDGTFSVNGSVLEIDTNLVLRAIH